MVETSKSMEVITSTFCRSSTRRPGSKTGTRVTSSGPCPLALAAFAAGSRKTAVLSSPMPIWWSKKLTDPTKPGSSVAIFSFPLGEVMKTSTANDGVDEELNSRLTRAVPSLPRSDTFPARFSPPGTCSVTGCVPSIADFGAVNRDRWSSVTFAPFCSRLLSSSSSLGGLIGLVMSSYLRIVSVTQVRKENGRQHRDADRIPLPVNKIGEFGISPSGVVGIRVVSQDVPFHPQLVHAAVVCPENRIKRRHERAHVAANQIVDAVMRGGFQRPGARPVLRAVVQRHSIACEGDEVRLVKDAVDDGRPDHEGWRRRRGCCGAGGME